MLRKVWKNIISERILTFLNKYCEKITQIVRIFQGKIEKLLNKFIENFKKLLKDLH